jgi:uncharacterized repeat protein (TIGR01451 family)
MPPLYTSPDPVVNTASVTSTTPDTNPGTTPQPTLTPLGPRSTSSSSSPSRPHGHAAGSDVVTIVIRNYGPSDAANVTVTDPLPAGMTFVSMTHTTDWTCSTPAVGANGVVSCVTPNFSALAVATFTVTAKVPAGAASGARFDNTAVVSSTTREENPDNNDDDATVTVANAGSDLGITKSASPNPVTPGSSVLYTLVITNYGPSTAQNAAFTDPLPAGTTFSSIPVFPAGWTWSSSRPSARTARCPVRCPASRPGPSRS